MVMRMRATGWLARSAVRIYFELSFRLLDSPEGRQFSRLAGPSPGIHVHGYTTRSDLDALVTHLEPGAGDLLLDLGSGMGGIALELSRRTGAQVTGVDVSAKAVAVATTRAHTAGLYPAVSFVRGSIRRPPLIGATEAFALDSLMFVPVDPDALRGIGDALHGSGRLFASVLAVGSAAGDPVRAVADELGEATLLSEDVTDDLVRTSRHRRRVAAYLTRHGRRTVRGQLAMTVITAEELAVESMARAGRLHRWRTVVRFGAPSGRPGRSPGAPPAQPGRQPNTDEDHESDQPFGVARGVSADKDHPDEEDHDQATRDVGSKRRP
jgi:SAM-dependent methyltransferase